MTLTDYRYKIYLYTKTDYGSTGISYSTKAEAVKHASKMISLNECSYGIFVEYYDEGIYHRRLVWKDGEDVIRKYSKKLSSSAVTMLSFIKSFILQNRRNPTFDEIKQDLHKRDYDVHRVLNILDEAGEIELTKPFSKTEPFKIKKS